MWSKPPQWFGPPRGWVGGVGGGVSGSGPGHPRWESAWLNKHWKRHRASWPTSTNRTRVLAIDRRWSSPPRVTLAFSTVLHVSRGGAPTHIVRIVQQRAVRRNRILDGPCLRQGAGPKIPVSSACPPFLRSPALAVPCQEHPGTVCAARRLRWPRAAQAALHR